MSKTTTDLAREKTSLLVFLIRPDVFLPLASFTFSSLAILLKMIGYEVESIALFIIGLTAGVLAVFFLNWKGPRE